MLDISFDELWDGYIVPMSNELYNRMIELDKSTKVTVCNLPQDKVDFKEMYENTKDTLKQLYHYNNTDKVRKIDIHKVAACFASVIMEYKIYKFEVVEETSDEVFLSNARLAYNISLTIIKENILYRYRNDEKTLEFVRTHKLYMPKTTDGHDKFSLGRTKTLMLNDIFLDGFDILSYSDMLYWIELFNVMILEDKKAIDYAEEQES